MLLLFFHMQNLPQDTTTVTRHVHFLIDWQIPFQYK